MSVENYNRKYGDVVAFHTPFEGTGKIVGCATNGAAVIGRGWIVEVLTSPDEFNWDDYPFTHIMVFDGHMIKISKQIVEA